MDYVILLSFSLLYYFQLISFQLPSLQNSFFVKTKVEMTSSLMMWNFCPEISRKQTKIRRWQCTATKVKNKLIYLSYFFWNSLEINTISTDKGSNVKLRESFSVRKKRLHREYWLTQSTSLNFCQVKLKKKEESNASSKQRRLQRDSFYHREQKALSFKLKKRTKRDLDLGTLKNNRKSSLDLSASSPVLNWRSCSVAKSRY